MIAANKARDSARSDKKKEHLQPELNRLFWDISKGVKLDWK